MSRARNQEQRDRRNAAERARRARLLADPIKGPLERDRARRAQARRYAKDRDKILQYNREWHANNRDKNKARHLAWKARNPDRVLSFTLRKFGLTPEEYRRILAAQGGVCAICKGPPRGKGRYHVDHDHLTNRVRGLLCGPCNQGIGLLGESPETIEAAANYLRRWIDG